MSSNLTVPTMPYKDKQRRSEYQREWMAKRRADYFSGKLCPCGSDDRLELDHIDRTKKVDHRIWSWADKRRLEELAKCQILCYKCHKKKTRSELTTTQHGTYAMRNNHGCTCKECKEYVRNQKRNRRSKGLRN